MKRRRRRGTPPLAGIFFTLPQDEETRTRLEYWVLKILLDLKGYRNFVDEDSRIRDDDIARFLGLERFMGRFEADEEKMYPYLHERLEELEETEIPLPSVLARNLHQVRRLVGLDTVETDLLCFAVHLHYYDVLQSAVRLIEDIDTQWLFSCLALLLGYDRAKVKAALSPSGRLAASSLLNVDRNASRTMDGKLDLFSDGFADGMMTFEGGIEEMLKEAARPCGPAELSLKDFDHLDEDLSLLQPYLFEALRQKKHGVNILLYGVPGTGKTELVKALAASLKCRLYEVSYADEDGDPLNGYRRLRAYGIAQSFFGSGRTMILFDEIEDVIDRADILTSQPGPKAWFNRILERNPAPAVWVTNDVASIDPALLRRFDLSVEVPVPPKEKRMRILERFTSGLLDEEAVGRIAEQKHIPPALVTRAASVLREIDTQVPDTSGAFTRLLDNTLRAQGQRPVGSGRMEASLPRGYDPALLNIPVDPEALVEGITAHPDARLCFYGVPGTGKSAFGKWVAEKTGRPFVLKKGSDLLSMWVGGTEKNIASAFEEARREGAVLVFDEVDGFLRDRQGADRSWEVTQVNEMLVQMENFEGIFIATTNLMEGLDPASLRRFDLKLEFGYLRPEQAWTLFRSEARALGLRVNGHARKLIESAGVLAPGDFAAVRRQHRFDPVRDATDLARRLLEECEIKRGGSAPTVGFVR